MVISELISRMEDIKARYGDCRVFILSKSFYENGTIIDAQDILLTSFVQEDSGDKEVIAMISNCPVVGAVSGTEWDAERILGKVASKDKEAKPDKLPRLFIGMEDVLLAMFHETKKYYVDYSSIDKFSDFLSTKISSGEFENYEGVARDLNMDAFIRTAGAAPHMFDITGNRMYLRVEWDELVDYINEVRPDNTVHDLVCEFLEPQERPE